MKRYLALAAMVLTLMGLAHYIELTARPDSGRRPDGATGVQMQQDGHAGHDH